MLNYDFDEDDKIVKLLEAMGYSIEGEFIHPYSSDPSGTFSIEKNEKYYYASFVSSKAFFTNDSEKIKEIYKILYPLEVVPHCEFIDIKEGTIIISESFGQAYSEFLSSNKDPELEKEIEYQIKSTLTRLHNLGFYHCDIHSGNILVDTKTKKVKLIDLETCTNNIHKILKHYGVNCLEEATSLENDSIKFEI